MSGNKTVKKVLPVVAALAGAAAVLYVLWRQGAFLPRWAEWESGTFYGAAGDCEYELALRHRRVQVLENGFVLWTSPDGMKVQQAMSCDIDCDGEEELVLLCWKVGRYGRSRPFWVEKDEQKWSQHVSVYEYAQEGIRLKWMASDLGQDVVRMAAENRASAVGEQEMAGDSAEGAWQSGKAPGGEPFRMSLLLTAPDGRVSSWRWDSWGFTREETEVSFAVFGDNLIHEPIYRYGLQHDGDFSFLYEKVREEISKSDIAVINQETPFVDRPSRYSDYPRFGTPVQVGEAMADAGFDVVTCATNHALDQGAYGVACTKNFLKAKGIVCLGIELGDEETDKPYDIIVRNGIRFAMLNYTYGTNGIWLPEESRAAVRLLEDEERVRLEIRRAKEESDFVIVFVHWGTEYAEQPDEFQRKWASVFLESGVDVTVGTHPHALQPWETLRGEDGHEMLVYYSIGNYVSAQSEKSCVKGGMAQFTVSLTADGYRVTDCALRPLRITWQDGGKIAVEL